MLQAVRSSATWALFTLLATSSCGSTQESTQDVATSQFRDSSVIEVEGCARRHGKTCVLPPLAPSVCEGRGREAVTIWMPASPHTARAAISIDGHPSQRPATQGEGVAWTIDDPRHTQEVLLRIGPARVWSMHFELPPDDPPALAKAREALTAGTQTLDVTQALGEALPGLTPPQRLAALDVLTDLLLRRLRRSSSDRVALVEEVERRSHQAYDLAIELGDVAHASCHARRALHTTLPFGDMSAAWWTRLATMQVSAPVEARNAYYLGLASRRSGELQAALDAFERVEVLEAQRGRAGAQLAALATYQRAVILANLGQHARALELLATFEAATDTLPCGDRLKARNNRAWLALLLREQGFDVEDPLPLLEETLDALRSGDAECFDASLETNVLINLGVAAAARGSSKQGAALLEELRSREDTTPSDMLWMVLLSLQLDAKNPQQPTHHDDEKIDAATLRPDERWRLAYWTGRSAEAKGETQVAISAYREAEAALSALTSSVRFDAGRDGLLLGRQPSAGRLVDLLLRRGETNEALCVARLARGRTDHLIARTSRIDALPPARLERWRRARAEAEQRAATVDQLRAELATRPLDARAAHETKIQHAQQAATVASQEAFAVLYGSMQPASLEDCASLRRSNPDALELLPFPLDRDGSRWAVFAFDAAHSQAKIVPRTAWMHDDKDAVADALLGPFEAQIAGAKQIRILPTGDTWNVPFAALPWHEAPLLAHAPVVFALDLATAPSPTAQDHAKRALVVGDPNGNLAFARNEAEHVRSKLTEAAWNVEHLQGARARAEPIRAALATSSLMHFAGHGLHAGDEGWSSRLQLADGQWLTVHDVLGLDTVPTVAVLPACEVANTAKDTLGGGMSIGRGFLLAGAQLVIAGRGPIDDAQALALSKDLYAQDMPSDGDKAASALQRALLHLYDEGDHAILHRVIALGP